MLGCGRVLGSHRGGHRVLVCVGSLVVDERGVRLAHGLPSNSLGLTRESEGSRTGAPLAIPRYPQASEMPEHGVLLRGGICGSGDNHATCPSDTARLATVFQFR